MRKLTESKLRRIIQSVIAEAGQMEVVNPSPNAIVVDVIQAGLQALGMLTDVVMSQADVQKYDGFEVVDLDYKTDATVVTLSTAEGETLTFKITVSKM